jgi:hypothetical protein
MTNQQSKYKRFMVFTWFEYDNVDPFGCVDDSFNTENEAKDYASAHGDVAEDGTKLYCVFDRVGGVFLEI